MRYRSGYRSRYRRRRNSHYGVLIALILVVVLAVPAMFHVVKGAAGAVFGGGRSVLAYQIGDTAAYLNGTVVEAGGTPYRGTDGGAMVPLQELCDAMGLELTWEQPGVRAVASDQTNTVQIETGSRTMQHGEESRQLSAAAVAIDGAVYVPVRDLCQAFSWQLSELDAAQGDLVLVVRSKEPLDEKKRESAAAQALAVLGPSMEQLRTGSIVMRVESDKLLTGGAIEPMREADGARGVPACVQDGVPFVPLKAAIAALGGSASFDGRDAWSVMCGGVSSTVQASGHATVDGKRVKGEDCTVYQDEETEVFYVSAPLFAALTGTVYTDLGDGAFAFTAMSLDGMDSKKAYLSSLKDGLTPAIGGDIPEADVYVALTFDDGPTGALSGYPDGLTATLLDGLKERGAHATFFMVGERVDMFSGTMQRLVDEGHELGNHTMTHPMQHLTGLSPDGIRTQISSATSTIQEKAGQPPTVLRPVGGGVNADVKAVAKELGLPIINWSLDTEDWKYRDAARVKQVIVDQVTDGAVVLMHDLYSTSVEGVLAAIDELQSRTDKTYAFVTVSELAAVKGITLEPGVVYNGLTEKVAQEIADGTYAPTEFT